MHTIIILHDGETWNTVNGCTIRTISDEDFQKLCEDRLRADETKAISEITLS